MNRRGQSIIEYALIAILVILGVVIMGPYVLRSVGAHFKLWDEGVQDSFSENLQQVPADRLPNIPYNCNCTPQDEGCGTGAASSCPQGYHAYSYPPTCQCAYEPATACTPDPNCCAQSPEQCGTVPLPAGYTNDTAPPPDSNSGVQPPASNNCYYGQEIMEYQCGTNSSIKCVDNVPAYNPPVTIGTTAIPGCSQPVCVGVTDQTNVSSTICTNAATGLTVNHGLTANVNVTYVNNGQCDGTQCQYSCNAGYHVDNGVCILNNPIITCGYYSNRGKSSITYLNNDPTHPFQKISGDDSKGHAIHVTVYPKAYCPAGTVLYDYNMAGFLNDFDWGGSSDPSGVPYKGEVTRVTDSSGDPGIDCMDGFTHGYSGLFGSAYCAPPSNTPPVVINCSATQTTKTIPANEAAYTFNGNGDLTTGTCPPNAPYLISWSEVGWGGFPSTNTACHTMVNGDTTTNTITCTADNALPSLTTKPVDGTTSTITATGTVTTMKVPAQAPDCSVRGIGFCSPSPAPGASTITKFAESAAAPSPHCDYYADVTYNDQTPAANCSSGQLVLYGLTETYSYKTHDDPICASSGSETTMSDGKWMHDLEGNFLPVDPGSVQGMETGNMVCQAEAVSSWGGIYADTGAIGFCQDINPT